jgi:cytochrome c-type biogenesis protein CcmH/NrfG
MVELRLGDLLAQASAHYRRGDMAAVVAVCRVILANEPSEPNGLYLLGAAQAQTGAMQAGVAGLRRTVTIASGATEAYLLLADALAKLARFPEAIEACEHGMLSASRPPQVRVARANRMGIVGGGKA